MSETIRRRLHRFRHISVWPLVFLIIFLSFIGTLQYYYKKEKANTDAHLKQAMQTVLNRLEAKNELVSLYTRFDDSDSRIYLNIGAYILEQQGYSQELIDWFNTDTEDGYYFFADAEGSLHTSEGVRLPGLSEDQLKQLRRGQSITSGRYTLMGKKCLDGLLVTGWVSTIPDTITDRVLFDVRDAGLIVLDTGTGEVQSITDPNGLITGGGIRYVADQQLTSESGRAMESGRILPETSDRPGSLLRRGVYLSCDLQGGQRIVLFSSITEIFAQSLSDAVISYLIMIVFAFITYRSTMLLRHRVKESGVRGFKRLTKRIYVHVPTFSRLVSLLLFSVLIFMGMTAYMQVLRDYSVNCNDATSDLKRITDTVRSDLEIRSVLQQRFESIMTERAYDLADCIDAMPQFMEQDQLQVLADIWDAEEISIFDSKGKIIRTTGKYNGYSLSSATGDAEYRCWDLLNGDAKSVVYPLNDGTDRYHVAVRRINQIGFIRFTVSAKQLNRLLSSINISSSILTSDYSGSILYLDSDTAGTGSWFTATSASAQTVTGVLPAELLNSGFIGIKKVDGRLSCIVTEKDENGIFVSVTPVSGIARDWVPMLLQNLVCYLVISLILLFGTGLFAGEEYEGAEEPKENRHSAPDTPHGKTGGKHNEDGLLLRDLLRRVLHAAFPVIPLMLVLNHLLSSNSILSFLISERWEKTPNVFSVTVVILMIIGAYCLCAVIRRICDQISSNLDSTTTTAVKLFSSILQVLIVAWMFISALYQVGVDMSTIVAGLGITTLALSLAAKDTVNDLIAGIFIVLDGNIRVGDYLEVNGFYGQVADMNIRTTKLRYFNQVKSINNSSMQNVVNYSRGTAGIWVSFCVTFDTDLRRLKQLIESNGDYFLREADKLQSPPVFCDAEKTDINGVTCAIWAPVDESQRKAMTRKARSALVTLLRDNGIQLARRYYADTADVSDLEQE